MGNWTGRWISSPRVKCKCKCGKENGAEKWTETFDSEHIDSLEHDGETREYIKYFCEVCANSQNGDGK